MVEVRRVTDDFAVAGQLAPEEMAQAHAQGFRLIVNNRPDHESPGQPTSAALKAAAQAAGLAYVHVPIDARSGPREVEAVRAALAQADGPALAFCRSGTRSITVWARGQAGSGARSREEVVRLAADAGYDLSASV